MLSKDIIALIDYYLTTKEVLFFEESLSRLVSLTNPNNCLKIIGYMDSQSITSELDISIYINEVASIKNKSLIDFIETKLLTFKDKEALEDLVEALNKINADS